MDWTELLDLSAHGIAVRGCVFMSPIGIVGRS